MGQIFGKKPVSGKYGRYPIQPAKNTRRASIMLLGCKSLELTLNTSMVSSTSVASCDRNCTTMVMTCALTICRLRRCFQQFPNNGRHLEASRKSMEEIPSPCKSGSRLSNRNYLLHHTKSLWDYWTGRSAHILLKLVTSMLLCQDDGKLIGLSYSTVVAQSRNPASCTCCGL